MSTADQTARWVLLVYRLPREPSTPRIALWRKLRRLGVAQLLDGLVALPADARTREQLDWLADEVLEAGGEATVWEATPTSWAQGRQIAQHMADTIASDYQAVLDTVATAADQLPAARRRTVLRLRRELRRIRSRDYFPPPQADEARRAVDELGKQVEVSP